MQKVVIIGCPGAGKTTFATQLATSSGLPLLHLDRFYHQQDKDYPNNTTAWRQKVGALVQSPAWIIDGNYRSTFDIRLDAADTIIYLDYSTMLVLWRAYKRRFKYRKSLRPDMPPGWKESLNWQFFKFMLSYRRKQRPEVLRLLDAHKSKSIIIFRRPREATRFLQDLAQT